MPPHRHSRRTRLGRFDRVVWFLSWILAGLVVFEVVWAAGVPGDWVIAFCLGVLFVLGLILGWDFWHRP